MSKQLQRHRGSYFLTATVLHRQSSAVTFNICEFGPWDGVHVDVVSPFCDLQYSQVITITATSANKVLVILHELYAQ